MNENQIVVKRVSKMSDEEFDAFIKPIEIKNAEYIKEVCISQYGAYHIANLYYHDEELLNYDLDIILKDIVVPFHQYTYKDCNIDKIEKILENNYNLKFVSKNPIKFSQIK